MKGSKYRITALELRAWEEAGYCVKSFNGRWWRYLRELIECMM